MSPAVIHLHFVSHIVCGSWRWFFSLSFGHHFWVTLRNSRQYGSCWQSTYVSFWFHGLIFYCIAQCLLLAHCYRHVWKPVLHEHAWTWVYKCCCGFCWVWLAELEPMYLLQGWGRHTLNIEHSPKPNPQSQSDPWSSCRSGSEELLRGFMGRSSIVPWSRAPSIL